MTIEYQVKDLNEHEALRIGLNGQTLLIENKALQEGTSKKNEFQIFNSGMILYGLHTLDIALLSDVQSYDPKYESKARVLIKRITIEGLSSGGAH